MSNVCKTNAQIRYASCIEYYIFTKTIKIPAARFENVELIGAHIGGSADPNVCHILKTKVCHAAQSQNVEPIRFAIGGSLDPLVGVNCKMKQQHITLATINN